MKKIHLIAIGFWLCQTALAQVAVNVEELRKKYPKEELVVLEKFNTLRITLKNDAPQVTNEYHEEIIYLSNNAPSYASESISYNSFNSIISLEAFTLIPKDDKFSKKKVKDFTEKDEFTSGIFVDDTKSKNFRYPSIENGCRSVLNYTVSFSEPRFLSSYYLRHSYPVLHEKLTIIVDNTIKLNIKQFNLKENIIINTEDNGNQTIYTFTNKSVDKYPNEYGTPSGSFFLPHVAPIIQSYTVKGEKKQLLETTADLYNWYCTLIEKIDPQDNENLVKLVDSLSQNCQTEIDKAKAIFDWVQKNIKYIALEDGLGGFVPRAAPQVCSKKYGDCKDMANLMVDMMQLAGLKGYHTWIGTRDRPYSYLDVPSPITDNHMIAMVRIDGVDYFLDATDKEIPFGFPSGHIQGKEALVGIDKNTFEVIEVPIVDAEINYYTYNGKLSIDGKKLIGNSSLTLAGYYKHQHNRIFTDLDPTEEKKIYRNYLELGNNKFLLNNYTVANQKDKNETTVVDFDFEIQDYITAYNDELFVNLGLEKGLVRTKIEADREFPIEYENKYSIYTIFELEVPAGYTVSSIPENASYTNELFQFTVSYSQSGNTITISQKYVRNCLIIYPESFAAWNELTKIMNQSLNESIILKKL